MKHLFIGAFDENAPYGMPIVSADETRWSLFDHQREGVPTKGVAFDVNLDEQNIKLRRFVHEWAAWHRCQGYPWTDFTSILVDGKTLVVHKDFADICSQSITHMLLKGVLQHSTAVTLL